VTELVGDALPQILALQKASWWQSSSINMPVFFGMLAMLALTVIFWPIKGVLRWRYGASFALSGRQAALYRLTRIVALCDVILFAGLLGYLTYAENNHLELLSPSYDWVLRLIQFFGFVGTVGVFVPVLNVVAAFQGKGRPWWTKGTDVLVALAAILSAWYAISQHFLVWNLNF
jgi:hypothetical protein